MVSNQLPFRCVCVDATGKRRESLELTVDMQCGVGDNSRMKRPLFNMMERNYADTVLRVQSKKIVESDCLALVHMTC